jgi:hypothetical protein
MNLMLIYEYQATGSNYCERSEAISAYYKE